LTEGKQGIGTRQRPELLLIYNVGLMISGRLEQPILASDAVIVEGGRIKSIGQANGYRARDFDVAIDARGTTLIPGLIDSHVHPTLGEYSPRADHSLWVTHCLHGGVTSMISAGEVHVPGRPVDIVGIKALAIAAQRSYSRARPAGVKLRAGAPLLEYGMGPEDFEQLAAAGVTMLGEVGIGSVKDPHAARELVAFARRSGLQTIAHTGGPSIPGSQLMDAEAVLEIDPDIIGHLNGGHTALSRQDIRCICESCNRVLEIVHNGNELAALTAIRIAKERDELGRVILGTDSPAGSGVPSLGMLRMIAFVSSFGEIPAEEAICLATGNTARARELDCGILEPGRAADFVIIDRPQGSAGRTVLESIQLGDLPGVSMVIIDGEVLVHPSRNTPPATTLPTLVRRSP
jgi:enamidase